MPMKRNYHSDKENLPHRELDVGKDTAATEAIHTNRVLAILNALALQLKGTTRHQTAIYKLIPLVTPRFAYDNSGKDRLPTHYRPGFNHPDHLWWPVLRYALCGLLATYYDAISLHRTGPFNEAATRFETFIEVGIKKFLLSPAEPAGYVLRTQEEWNTIKAAKARRETEILDNKDRLARLRKNSGK